MHVWESMVTTGHATAVSSSLPDALKADTKKMARKKISTTVYITPEQNEALHVLHNRTKVPVAVYIREGIDLVLEKYADQLPGQMSLVDTQDNK